MAWHERNNVPVEEEILSRRDYQEILLARMAGGDLYANELLLRIRRADKALDKLRVACGGKAIYGESVKRTAPDTSSADTSRTGR